MSHADTQLKEQKDHGTSLFPCALYEVCEEKTGPACPITGMMKWKSSTFLRAAILFCQYGTVSD